MMPSHESVIDADTVTWEFSVSDGVPETATYVAAVIPRPPDEPVAQQPGVVGPQHRVGLSTDRMVDMLASALQDRYLRPQRERLFGVVATSAPESPEAVAAMRQLQELEKLEFPYPVYGCVVPGKTQADQDVVGVIVFYMEGGETRNGQRSGSSNE